MGIKQLCVCYSRSRPQLRHVCMHTLVLSVFIVGHVVMSCHVCLSVCLFVCIKAEFVVLTKAKNLQSMTCKFMYILVQIKGNACHFNTYFYFMCKKNLTFCLLSFLHGASLIQNCPDLTNSFSLLSDLQSINQSFSLI